MKMTSNVLNLENLLVQTLSKNNGSVNAAKLVSMLARVTSQSDAAEFEALLVVAKKLAMGPVAMEGVAEAAKSSDMSWFSLASLRSIMIFCVEENFTQSLLALLEEIRFKVSKEILPAFLACYAFTLSAQHRQVEAAATLKELEAHAVSADFAIFAIYAGAGISSFSEDVQQNLLNSFDDRKAYIRDWIMRAAVADKGDMALKILRRLSSMRDLESFLNEYFIFGVRSKARDLDVLTATVANIASLMRRANWKKVSIKADLSGFGHAEELNDLPLMFDELEGEEPVLIRNDIAAFSSRYILRFRGDVALSFGFSGPGGGFYVQIRQGAECHSYFEDGRVPDQALAKRFALMSTNWLESLSPNAKLTVNTNFFRLGDSLERSAYYLWVRRFYRDQQRSFEHRVLASVKENFIRIEDLQADQVEVHAIADYLRSNEDYANAIFFRNPVDRRMSFDDRFVNALADCTQENPVLFGQKRQFVVMVSIEEEKRSFERQWQAFQHLAHKLAKNGIQEVLVLNSGMTATAIDDSSESEGMLTPNTGRLFELFAKFIPKVEVIDLNMKSIYVKSAYFRKVDFYIAPLGTAGLLPAAAGGIGLLYGNRHYSREENLWSKNEGCWRIPECLIEDTNSGNKKLKFDLNQSTSYTTHEEIMKNYLDSSLCRRGLVQ
jgi:hypothetical protein